MKAYRQLPVHDAQRGDQLFDEMIFFAALDRDNGFGQIFFYFNIDLQVMHLLTDPILSDVECEAKGLAVCCRFCAISFREKRSGMYRMKIKEQYLL